MSCCASGDAGSVSDNMCLCLIVGAGLGGGNPLDELFSAQMRVMSNTTMAPSPTSLWVCCYRRRYVPAEERQIRAAGARRDSAGDVRGGARTERLLRQECSPVSRASANRLDPLRREAATAPI